MKGESIESIKCLDSLAIQFSLRCYVAIEDDDMCHISSKLTERMTDFSLSNISQEDPKGEKGGEGGYGWQNVHFPLCFYIFWFIIKINFKQNG